MNENKILLVDDEPNLLFSMQRQLRKRFTVLTAQSGEEALEIMKKKGPVAVIMSDMHMPGMDGVKLLAMIKDSYPETVRIMLTGDDGQGTAAQAVNTGHIFRFLTKPCSSAVLITTIAVAVRQYHLITSEKELLNKTVKDSITVMAEMLSLANAPAFSCGYRIKPLVKYIAQKLQLPNLWQYELAALMSQLGCITLPVEVLQKVHAGVELSEEEQKMYDNHPEVGSRLIQKISRLGTVAAIIKYQLYSFYNTDEADLLEEEIGVGAGILKIAIDYDLLRQQDVDHGEAVKRMRGRKNIYSPEILKRLETYRPQKIHTVISNLSFKDVVPGMIAARDVLAKNGTLLIPKNQEITWTTIQGLANFEKQIGIVEPICVHRAEHEEVCDR